MKSSKFLVAALTAVAMIQVTGCDDRPSGVQTPEPRVSRADADIVRKVEFAAVPVTTGDYAALGIELGDSANGTPGAALIGFRVIAELVEPADVDSLRAGDVVTSLAEQPIHSAADFKAVLATLKPGSRVRAVVARGGGFEEVRITVGKARATFGANHA